MTISRTAMERSLPHHLRLRLRPPEASDPATASAPDGSVGSVGTQLANPFGSPPAATASAATPGRGAHPCGRAEAEAEGGAAPAQLPPWPAEVARSSAHKRAVEAGQMAALRDHLRAVAPAAHAWLQAPAQAAFRLSRLRGEGGEAGEVILVTSTLIQGTFGKLRLGRRVSEGAGGAAAGAAVLAVKEVRMAARRARDGHKPGSKRGPLTCFTGEAMLRDELQAACAFSRHCRPEAAYDCAGKIYTLMPLMPCSLGTAAWRLSGQDDLTGQVAAGFYVFRAVAEQLEGAHLAGQVHGDVKPDNLLVGDGGELELADWGISQRTGADGLAHDMSCTLAYAAPEMLWGQGIDGAADMWSLGVSVVELVEPELQRGRDRPRHPALFVGALAAVRRVSAPFADFLRDRVLVAHPGVRARAGEAGATLDGWEERPRLCALGRRRLAQVAEPEPPIAMGRQILAAHSQLCGRTPSACPAGEGRSGNPAVAHSVPSASTRRASQPG